MSFEISFKLEFIKSPKIDFELWEMHSIFSLIIVGYGITSLYGEPTQIDFDFLYEDLRWTFGKLL